MLLSACHYEHILRTTFTLLLCVMNIHNYLLTPATATANAAARLRAAPSALAVTLAPALVAAVVAQTYTHYQLAAAVLAS
jgi:hypothetical protein